jgi:RNA polymerase sigma-70 factor (ECF subfamily)
MISAVAVTTAGTDRVTAFVLRHQVGLWRWLCVLGCDAARAEEHAQDALLAALHHGVDALPMADASRWLRTAARNLHRMRLRAERRRPRSLPLDDVEAAWVALRGDEDGGKAALEALDLCLASLSARDRELVDRRYRIRQPRQAIGAELGIGDAGVKQALRRVRERLRVCIERRIAVSRREV